MSPVNTSDMLSTYDKDTSLNGIKDTYLSRIEEAYIPSADKDVEDDSTHHRICKAYELYNTAFVSPKDNIAEDKIIVQIKFADLNRHMKTFLRNRRF